MHIESLKYLLAVQQTGSMHKASAQLNTSHQNISKVIKALETELQVQLFERTSQGMVPTAEAQPAFKLVKNILENYEALLNLYQPTLSQTNITGSVAVSVFHYSRHLLTNVLTEFIPLYPDIQVLTNEISTNKNYGNIVILPQMKGHHFSEYEKVIPLDEAIPTVLVKKDSPLGKQKSITLKKYGQYPTVVQSQSSYENSLYYHLMHNKLTLKYPPLVVNDVSNYLLYISSGKYIGFGFSSNSRLPENLPNDLVRLKVRESNYSVTTYLLVKDTSILTQAEQFFINFLQNYFLNL